MLHDIIIYICSMSVSLVFYIIIGIVIVVIIENILSLSTKSFGPFGIFKIKVLFLRLNTNKCTAANTNISTRLNTNCRT